MRFILFVLFALLAIGGNAQKIYTSDYDKEKQELVVTEWSRLLYCQEGEGGQISLNESQDKFWVILNSKESAQFPKSGVKSVRRDNSDISFVISMPDGNSLSLRKKNNSIIGVVARVNGVTVKTGENIL